MAKYENHQEADVLDEVRILRERIDKECPNSMGWRVVSLLESLKALEKQEFDFQSHRSSDCSRLQQEVDELDKMLHSGRDDEDSDKFHRSFQDSNERLESAKKALEKQEFDFQSHRSSDCSRLQQEVDELDKMLHSGRDDEDSDKFHRSFQDSNERLESAKKALEKQEFDFQSHRSSDCSRLQQEVDELDKMLHSGRDDEDSDKFHRSFQDSNERLESAKKELATELRSIVSLKRQLDEVPSPSELIQYELRFSELNTQIQKKLGQTRKHYDTYNALLEIKELMLKETSLLNSISLQFQNAITSADGRMKLINSLEGILNGTQQKLEKVQLALQSEQKFSDTIKEKYAAAISEQRQSSSLLKLFQEECARNERLRAQIHEHEPCT